MRIVAAFLAVLGFSRGAEVAAAEPTRPSSEAIVVTAQRSGIPVWHVRNGVSTLVLVGTIEDVAKGTDWKPERLAEALRAADQVMFPQATQLTGGLFQLWGAPRRVRRMERLPAGETLAKALAARQFDRLLRLQRAGLLRPGFQYRRPLFVAFDLIQAAKGEHQSGGFLSVARVDWKTDPQGFVLNAIKKYNLRLMPMRRKSLNAALTDIASLPTEAQLPCLSAAADLAEAGAGLFQARSIAWSTRRVPAVVNSLAEKALVTCGKIVRDEGEVDDLHRAVTAALHQPLTTVAVVELSTLAENGGLLDYLASRGFELSGPQWK